MVRGTCFLLAISCIWRAAAQDDVVIRTTTSLWKSGWSPKISTESRSPISRNPIFRFWTTAGRRRSGSSPLTERRPRAAPQAANKEHLPIRRRRLPTTP